MADDAKVQQAVQLLEQVQQLLSSAVPPASPSEPAGSVTVNGTLTSMVNIGGWAATVEQIKIIDNTGVTHVITTNSLAAIAKFTPLLGQQVAVNYVPKMPSAYDQVYSVTIVQPL